METWKIAVISAACVVALAVIVLVVLSATGVIFSRRRRANADRAGATARQLKRTRTSAVNSEAALVNGNAEKCQSLYNSFAEKLSADSAENLDGLVRALRYLSPYDLPEIKNADKKISLKLDDLKEILYRGKYEDKAIDGIIFDIKALAAARKALIWRT